MKLIHLYPLLFLFIVISGSDQALAMCSSEYTSFGLVYSDIEFKSAVIKLFLVCAQLALTLYLIFNIFKDYKIKRKINPTTVIKNSLLYIILFWIFFFIQSIVFVTENCIGNRIENNSLTNIIYNLSTTFVERIMTFHTFFVLIALVSTIIGTIFYFLKRKSI